MNWQPIETLHGKKWVKSERFDLWVKWWDAETDTFRGKRAVDCYLDGLFLVGVPKGTKPTHWMPTPPPPENT